MAKIFENNYGRRTIKMSTDDIISTVREYQRIIRNIRNYTEIREKLNKNEIFIPEDY
jgi:hypothetical protein